MTNDLFEQATRYKLRFDLPQGQVNIEQLWEVKTEPLTTYEEQLTALVESFGKTSRRKSTNKTVAQTRAELQLAIVSYILDVRERELEASQSAAEIKAHNESIQSLIIQKKQIELANLSVAELEKLLK